MAKKIVIVCSFLDSAIREYFKDSTIEIYKDVVDLSRKIADVPIRADKLIVSSDTTEVAPTVAFNELINVFSSSFFKCSEFIFVSAPDTKSLAVLDFIKDDGRIPTPQIITGTLSREFMVSAIRGTAMRDKPATRIVVERQRRSTYIRDQLAQRQHRGTEDIEGEQVVTEEQRLGEISDVEEEPFSPLIADGEARTIQVVGQPERGKTTFLLLLAQFIARTNKVVILENDFEYYSMSNLVTLGNIECTELDIELLYTNPSGAVALVTNSPTNLIAVTGRSAYRHRRYQSSFVNRLCFSLFNDICDYILLESELSSMLQSTRTIMVLKNELVPILKDLQYIPFSVHDMDFVSLSSSTLFEGQIYNSQELTALVSELLNIPIVQPIPIYRIDSLKIGGHVYDLHRYM